MWGERCRLETDTPPTPPPASPCPSPPRGRSCGSASWLSTRATWPRRAGRAARGRGTRAPLPVPGPCPPARRARQLLAARRARRPNGLLPAAVAAHVAVRPRDGVVGRFLVAQVAGVEPAAAREPEPAVRVGVVGAGAEGRKGGAAGDGARGGVWGGRRGRRCRPALHPHRHFLALKRHAFEPKPARYVAGGAVAAEARAGRRGPGSKDGAARAALGAQRRGKQVGRGGGALDDDARDPVAAVERGGGHGGRGGRGGARGARRVDRRAARLQVHDRATALVAPPAAQLHSQEDRGDGVDAVQGEAEEAEAEPRAGRRRPVCPPLARGRRRGLVQLRSARVHVFDQVSEGARVAGCGGGALREEERRGGRARGGGATRGRRDWGQRKRAGGRVGIRLQLAAQAHGAARLGPARVGWHDGQLENARAAISTSRLQRQRVPKAAGQVAQLGVSGGLGGGRWGWRARRARRRGRDLRLDLQPPCRVRIDHREPPRRPAARVSRLVRLQAAAQGGEEGGGGCGGEGGESCA